MLTTTLTRMNETSVSNIRLHVDLIDNGIQIDPRIAAKISEWADIAFSTAQQSPTEFESDLPPDFLADIDHAEVAISLFDINDMQSINLQYREKGKPTNVLSFPAGEKTDKKSLHLGDILLCPEIINKEAVEQEKATTAHWAHMVVHGMLHLNSFDHISDDQATEMEALEIQILADLGFNNPYT